MGRFTRLLVSSRRMSGRKIIKPYYLIAPGEKNGQQFNKQNSHFERKRERVREYEEKRLTV